MNELFAKRRSNRFLSNKPLSNEEIDSIIKAGEHAPIALGRYDDIILNVYQGKKLEELKDAYKKVAGRDIFYDCSLLVIVTHKNTYGPLANERLANQNAGAIIENMLLQATDLNIGNVFVFQPVRFGLQHPEILELLEVEEGYEPITGAIFGYKTSEEVRDIKHEIKVKKFN